MLGALISAGSSILGGILGNKAAKSAATQQAKLQKQFAQNGIQWKVEDAKKAGVHPLYALGANTIAYSPQSVGDSLGPAIASAGQDIGRAIDSGRTTGERLTARLGALQIQRAELENAKLASEIRLMQQPGTAPAPVTENAIIDGQANSTITAKEVQTVINPENPAAEPVGRPDIMFTRVQLAPGRWGYAVNPSTETAEAMESNPLGQLQFMVRNGLAPFFTQDQNKAPPQSWLPPGYNQWKFDFGDGVWKPTLRIPRNYNIRSKGTIR
ncbi:DNA pilot protein [Apis mellifera associated microvirus 42]|nr:DNA pilot protein [Apis mellifera associated microvirus 42]